MNDNYMKTILSGVKEWTENLTDDAKDKANNALDKANNALDKALFVVNITQNSDGTPSADKTFEEIINVYNEGKYNIVAAMWRSYVFIIPLLAITESSGAVFSVTFDDEVIRIIITSNNKILLHVTRLATTNSTLPNPHPLTFTGAVNETYDGSIAKTIKIPIGADGKSAYSYAQDGGYTGTEAEFAAKLAAEKLPNPYPLTFTGAVSETYDGSIAKTIKIPIGADGKSAYSYAQDGGYTDTEANFYADLAAMQGLASALAAI